MADLVDKETRSQMMSGIRGKDTKPELIIRKALHAQGLRFRLHSKGLPGKPDLVFRKYGAVIFINGCFWHAHTCHLVKKPATNADFWRRKIAETKARDHRSTQLLLEQGWRVLIVWECALRGVAQREKMPQVVGQIVRWLKCPGRERFLDISGD